MLATTLRTSRRCDPPDSSRCRPVVRHSREGPLVDGPVEVPVCLFERLQRAPARGAGRGRRRDRRDGRGGGDRRGRRGRLGGRGPHPAALPATPRPGCWGIQAAPTCGARPAPRELGHPSCPDRGFGACPGARRPGSWGIQAAPTGGARTAPGGVRVRCVRAVREVRSVARGRPSAPWAGARCKCSKTETGTSATGPKPSTDRSPWLADPTPSPALRRHRRLRTAALRRGPPGATTGSRRPRSHRRSGHPGRRSPRARGAGRRPPRCARRRARRGRGGRRSGRP